MVISSLVVVAKDGADCWLSLPQPDRARTPNNVSTAKLSVDNFILLLHDDERMTNLGRCHLT
ncbi:hypothetical protein [Moraxella lacunata]|uniref:hypothetical protein n=1 Tax=Moraxella lacunata TaxID=477 RepID=UPI003EDF55CD